MSSNAKGSVEQRVNLVKRGPGEIQHVMLNSVLIQKAENYSLMTDRFVTNVLTELMQNPRTLMKFQPRGEIDDEVEGFDITQGDEAFLDRIHEFKSPSYSVAGLCEALAVFVRDFNFAIFIQGADFTFAGDEIQRNAILTGVGYRPFDIGNYIDPAGIVDYVTLGFSPDGRMQLTMRHEFLTNFYIEFDPVFARLIGFPQFIYGDYVGGVITMSNQVTTPDLLYSAQDFAGNVLQHFVNDSNMPAAANGNPRTIESTKSIYSCDDRLSLDIEISLPLSQSIDVFNGKEQHTFLLNRFMITDYINIAGRTQQKGGVILTKSLINDQMGSGFTDLVKNQPTSPAAKLLNGKIQEMDLRMVLRYKKYSILVDDQGLLSLPKNQLQFTIERKTLQLDENAAYDLLLAFNKRV